MFRLMSGCLSALLVAFGLHGTAVIGQSTELPPVLQSVPDVVACGTALQQLDQAYGATIREECFSAAYTQCLGQGAPCFSEINGKMRSFYAEMLPALPASIEADAPTVDRYSRFRADTIQVFEELRECEGLSGAAFAECEYIELALATDAIFIQAHMAGVPLD